MSVLLNSSTLQGITVSLENINIIIIGNTWLNDDCGMPGSGNGCGGAGGREGRCRIVVAKSEKGWLNVVGSSTPFHLYVFINQPA
jgi:hypothetical protein